MQRTITETERLVPMLPSKLRVAAYARVSSGKDTMLKSLSAQISYYSAYIQRHADWEYTGVYFDEAITGTKDTRVEFQRLLADCEGGRIDMIITKSISRFARNTVTLLETVRNLKAMGIDVYFEEQNIHTMSGDGELMLTILASYAQEESLSTSENCKWRIRNKFKEGVPNTLCLYGYDFVDRGLVVNPVEAGVVRMVFTDYLKGLGKNAIMRKLTAANVPTKKGGRWSESAIDKMLRNEKYSGNMLLQKNYSANHITKAKRINHGELPMFYVEDSHVAIIDPQTFEAVQAELAERAKQYENQAKIPTYSEFAGIIHCGVCGANFRRKTNKAGTKYARVVWSCKTYSYKGMAYCASRQIPENILKDAAADAIGIDEYDEGVFTSKVVEIRVPENGVLIFVFKDGTEVARGWQNKPRSESWNHEMRCAAGEKSRIGVK